MQEQAKKKKDGASGTLGEADATDFEPLFKELGITAKALHADFVTKKPQLENTSNCKATRESLLAVLISPGNFVDAIVNSADAKAKGLIAAYAKDYLDNLKSAYREVGLMKDRDSK